MSTLKSSPTEWKLRTEEEEEQEEEEKEEEEEEEGVKWS